VSSLDRGSDSWVAECVCTARAGLRSAAPRARAGCTPGAAHRTTCALREHPGPPAVTAVPCHPPPTAAALAPMTEGRIILGEKGEKAEKSSKVRHQRRAQAPA
jgi:hypothetical protein